MQTDPVGYDDGFNWYDYVHNDPVNHTDPSGLTCTGSPNHNLDCHIDRTWTDDNSGVPTAAQQKQEQAFNKAYTAAEKQLLADPNKTVTLHNFDGASFNVKAGDVAARLANTNVIADLRSSSNLGNSNMAQSNDHLIQIFGKGLAAVVSSAQQRQQDRETTIVHEGIHYGPGEDSVYHRTPQTDPRHGSHYDAAADELLNQGP